MAGWVQLMNKTNKELNTEHDKRQQEKVRPKPKQYNYEELQAIILKWNRNVKTWILQSTASSVWRHTKGA